MSDPLIFYPIRFSISPLPSPHVTSPFNFSLQGFQGQTGPPGPAGVVGPQVRVNSISSPSFVPVGGYLGGSGSQAPPPTPYHLCSRWVFFLSRERQEKQDL